MIPEPETTPEHPESPWNHSICEQCWIEKNLELSDDNSIISIRRPTLLKEPSIERCCYCGLPTIFGAYVRDDPAIHDHKGYSQEQCVRCGWVMGHPPLNCMNDNTPHVFPSSLLVTQSSDSH